MEQPHHFQLWLLLLGWPAIGRIHDRYYDRNDLTVADWYERAGRARFEGSV